MKKFIIPTVVFILVFGALHANARESVTLDIAIYYNFKPAAPYNTTEFYDKIVSVMQMTQNLLNSFLQEKSFNITTSLKDWQMSEEASNVNDIFEMFEEEISTRHADIHLILTNTKLYDTDDWFFSAGGAVNEIGGNKIILANFMEKSVGILSLILLHEIGHALNLTHPQNFCENPQNLMCPSAPYQKIVVVEEAYLQAIHNLYLKQLLLTINE